VTIVNTGNVKLRAVQVSTALSSFRAPQPATLLTAYNCKLNGGSGTPMGAGLELPVSGTFVCTATYTWSTVEAIESGDVTFTPTVSATDYRTAIALTDGTVAVPSQPHFSISISDTLCASATPAPENFAGGYGALTGLCCTACKERRVAAPGVVSAFTSVLLLERHAAVPTAGVEGCTIFSTL
jgi:hypothetical protein